MELYQDRLLTTEPEEVLLQAALLDRLHSIKAWKKWRSTTNIEDQLDSGSFRLLPLVYKKLKGYGIQDPLMNRLKGIYRMAWCKNQILFYELTRVLQRFHDAGIRTMLLKGAALALLHYKNYGVRPMADLDVAVPTKQAPSAIDLLTRTGWIPRTRPSKGDLRYRHSMQFKNKDGQELDLHWHVLYECCREGSDDEFWEGAIPLQVNEVSTYALNASDTLLHAIIHGVRWNEERPIRWIADAFTVINTSGSEIDWIRVLEQAKKRQLILRLSQGLRYLRRKFHVKMPQIIVDTIDEFPVSFLERIENRYIMTNQEKTLMGGLPSLLVQYLRLMNGRRIMSTVGGLLDYLKYRWNAKSTRHLISLLVFKSLTRTIRAISPRSRIERSTDVAH
jgi:hypothetical protein